MTATRATFLGRFQPLHIGHYRTIDTYCDEYDEFVVALGSPQKSRTPENPLTAGERKGIIHACFPEIEIVEIEDEDRGEAGYEEWVTRFVERTDADVVISGNDLVRRLVREHTDADLVQQEMHAPDRYSGTEIRRRIREGESWRDLVPDCCEEVVAEYEDVICESGEGGDAET